MCWNPYFYSAFWDTLLKRSLEQILTSQRAKLGPDNNSTWQRPAISCLSISCRNKRFFIKNARNCRNVKYVGLCSKKVHKLCSFCRDVERIEYVKCFGNWQQTKLIGSNEHIQHVQHSCRKKHAYKRKLEIAVLLSMLGYAGKGLEKGAPFCRNVEYVECCWSLQAPYSTYSTPRLKEAD